LGGQMGLGLCLGLVGRRVGGCGQPLSVALPVGNSSLRHRGGARATSVERGGRAG
jgi:hypothetical protein